MSYAFRQFNGGGSVDNLGDYLREYVKTHPGVRIYVGCDSTVGRKCINYVIAVVLYMEGKGGHIIYARENELIGKENKYNLLQGRLIKEVGHSLAVAEIIEVELQDHLKPIEADGKICDIDLDLNPDFGDGHNKSNIVFEEGRGWVLGSGYRVRVKPFAYAATCAADKLLR